MTTAKEIMGGGFSAGQAAALGGGFNTPGVAATGSVQGNAAVLPLTALQIVTGADGTKGVILPAATTGDEILIFNNSASTLNVYPPTGAAIAVVGTGLGTANTAFSHLTFKYVQYNCASSTQWFAMTSA
jgi:hypothetical protein